MLSQQPVRSSVLLPKPILTKQIEPLLTIKEGAERWKDDFFAIDEKECKENQWHLGHLTHMLVKEFRLEEKEVQAAYQKLDINNRLIQLKQSIRALKEEKGALIQRLAKNKEAQEKVIGDFGNVKNHILNHPDNREIKAQYQEREIAENLKISAARKALRDAQKEASLDPTKIVFEEKFNMEIQKAERAREETLTPLLERAAANIHQSETLGQAKASREKAVKELAEMEDAVSMLDQQIDELDSQFPIVKLDLINELQLMPKMYNYLTLAIDTLSSDHLTIVSEDKRTGVVMASANTGGFLGGNAYDGCDTDQLVINLYNPLFVKMQKINYPSVSQGHPVVSQDYKIEPAQQEQKLEAHPVCAFIPHDARIKAELVIIHQAAKNYRASIIGLTECHMVTPQLIQAEFKDVYKDERYTTRLVDNMILYDKTYYQKNEDATRVIQQRIVNIKEEKSVELEGEEEQIAKNKNINAERIQALVLTPTTGPKKGKSLLVLCVHLEFSIPSVNQAFLNTLWEVCKNYSDILVTGDFNMRFHSKQKGVSSLSSVRNLEGEIVGGQVV